jgi:hypothetical protein
MIMHISKIGVRVDDYLKLLRQKDAGALGTPLHTCFQYTSYSHSLASEVTYNHCQIVPNKA